MSAVPEQVQSEARAERPNPFGASIRLSEDTLLLTVQEASKRCEWIALDVEAEHYALYFLGPSVERPTLLPCFEVPASRPEATPVMPTRNLEAAARLSRASTLPSWWSATGAEEERPAPDLPDGFRLPEDGATRGVVLPVYADRGLHGLVAFAGPRLSLPAGRIWEIHARCFSLFAAVSLIGPEAAARPPQVTKRELECLKLTANGLTSGQIATALKLSVHTTNQYLTSVGQKLGADNRVHAVAKALRSGLIE
jgi:DNA-binding CsgD family transcriptional regulator